MSFFIKEKIKTTMKLNKLNYNRYIYILYTFKFLIIISQNEETESFAPCQGVLYMQFICFIGHNSSI